jgi:CspA family cold shock protein
MKFVDKMMTCERCGSRFVFTVTEQRDLADRGVELFEPRFCPTCRDDIEGIAKLIGHVKWFCPKRGYGFITKADGEDIFFHRTGVEGRSILEKGQEVEFEIKQTPKGPQAIKVAPLPANSEGWNADTMLSSLEGE